MVITGYDDTKSAYRVLNSWGPDWGDGGYLWWDYASLEAAQPHAYVIRALTTAPAALAPTPAPISITRPGNGRVVLRKGKLNNTDYWMLFVHADANEPVQISRLDTPFLRFNVSSAFASGELAFLMGTNQPAQGSTVPLTIVGKDRAGTPFTISLPDAIVPAPSL